MPLKLVDLLVSSPPFAFFGKALYPFHKHPAIPASIEDCYVSCLRELLPEAPEVMMSFLCGVGSCNGDHFVSPGVQFLGQPLDISSFSGSIPAFVDHDYAYALAVALELQFPQSFLQGIQLT